MYITKTPLLDYKLKSIFLSKYNIIYNDDLLQNLN